MNFSIIYFQNGYCIFRASSQLMIQLMDRNRNGKLDKREFNFDIDSLTSQPGYEEAKAYIPDLDKLMKKVSFVSNN